MENKEIIKELENLIAALKKSTVLRMENESKNYPPETPVDTILNNVRTVERELLAQNLQFLKEKIQASVAK